MEHSIWSDKAPEYAYKLEFGTTSVEAREAIEASGLGAARGLLFGLAISQVFWLIVAYFVF